MIEKSLVRISNVLNLTRQEFNTVEKHIFLLTLLHLKGKQGFNVDVDKEEIITINVSVKDLKESNRERIKEALDKITSRKIIFDNSTTEYDYFGFIVPFISAKYDSKDRSYSNIIVKLNPDCKKLFLELANGYTTTDLKAILSLKSTHSIRMYELISMYLNQGSWTVDISKLKNLLGLEYNNYKNFTDFERHILFYSQKELWEHCHLYFEWEIAKKERKKVIALTFRIKTKEKQENADLKDEIKQTIDYVSKLSPAEIARTYNLITSKYNLSSQQVDYILSDANVLNDFIRLDLIIESKIERGKPPKDRNKYMASSLKLDSLMKKSQKGSV